MRSPAFDVVVLIAQFVFYVSGTVFFWYYVLR